MGPTVLTIGHSTQAFEAFVELLGRHGVDAIADVRSEPFSSRQPEYNRELLRESLLKRGIQYVFLGRELGARPRDDGMYEDDRVRYDLLASAPRFIEGLRRVQEGVRRFRLALLCAEGDPLACHRSILIAPRLEDAGLEVAHIRTDGRLEPQEQAMERLLALHRLPTRDVFGGQAELVKLATARQEGRIAFRRARTPLERR